LVDEICELLLVQVLKARERRGYGVLGAVGALSILIS
jgi:hypothetical protein